MDQEETLDFKALRAKFQEEEHLLKQPKIKPALPEKPKVIPPPQSPTHYVPIGARPSLLTSISESLDSRTVAAPRVVFKEDKKEVKKPLIPIILKGKDKSEVKMKKSKDKLIKGSKETLDDDSVDAKPKKEKKLPLIPVAQKESTAELVPATPPPKITLQKKKGFLGFRKSKTYSLEVPEDAILDAPSSDLPGPAPLIPAPSDFSDIPPEPEFPAPKVLLPNIPTVPDSSAAVEPVSNFPDFTSALDISNIPESDTHFQIETPAMPLCRPASLDDLNQGPPSATPTPPPTRAVSRPPPVAPSPPPSPLEPEPAAEAQNVTTAEAEEAPSSPDSESNPSSPKSPISPTLALTRATEMSPAKKMSACDLRIFNALEKARRKISSHNNPSRSASVTPPPEDFPPNPTQSFLELPPIDYEGNALPPKPVNGLDHSEVSPVLEGIAEEGSDVIPEQMVVPPPPPKKVIPDSESLGPPPEKPSRPFSLNLNRFIPPPSVEDSENLAPPEFSENDTMDVPEFDDVASDAHSHSDWGNGDYVGPDSPDGQGYSNGMTPEVHVVPTDTLLPETSIHVTQETPPRGGLEADVGNGFYEITDNVYESVTSSAGKKKGKPELGKKRKGPPKNPYAEAQQETNEEKIKTGRFGKNDKKLVAEGPDEKELKKREKQRLEKEKKELKERQEKEKKEQKEREKKENEMKKKFKITGQEDAMYQAKVTVTNKGRKNDLPVTSGDIVNIIRTTNCPKGKWLARDGGSNYGYISVDHVELDIKEMLELGKKAAITRSNTLEEEANSPGNRASNHYPTSPESYTDDSEEWTGDEDDTLSPSPVTAEPPVLINHSRTHSMPDMGNKDVNTNHQHSRSDIIDDGTHVQARHEALQKLATFFHATKPVEPAASSEAEMSPVIVTEEEQEAFADAALTEETEFDPPEMLILPPPDLYADLILE